MSQTKRDGFQIGGIAHAQITVPTSEAHLASITGMFRNPDGRSDPGILQQDLGNGTVYIEGYLHNAFVNQGLQAALDAMYEALDSTADRISHIGLSADVQAVTAATTSLDPSGGGAGSTGTSIKAIANVSRASQTVSGDQTWTQADVSFVISKIGLLTSTAAGDVSNIIGGSGSAPYDEPFTIDLTNISTWTLTMGVDVTATAS